MGEFFNQVILQTLVGVSGELFIACAAVIFVACVTETVLALTVPNFERKKRTGYFFASFAAITFYSAVAGGADNSLVKLLVAFSALLAIPVTGVRVKTVKITEKQRELVRFLDSKIKCADYPESPTVIPETVSAKRETAGENRVNLQRAAETCALPRESERAGAVEVLKTSGKPSREKIKPCDLDFAHIRSVISRLDYFSLSTADKRVVNELELALNEGERGNDAFEIKERINDGLGALLKIMSKYGA